MDDLRNGWEQCMNLVLVIYDDRWQTTITELEVTYIIRCLILNSVGHDGCIITLLINFPTSRNA